MKGMVMALMCISFVFISTACAFNSDKPETLNKEKLVKARTPLFLETYPVAEGEMAASPYLTKPTPKTASTK